MKTSDLIPVFNQPEEKMREIQREAEAMTETETAGVVCGAAKLKIDEGSWKKTLEKMANGGGEP